MGATASPGERQMKDGGGQGFLVMPTVNPEKSGSVHLYHTMTGNISFSEQAVRAEVKVVFVPFCDVMGNDGGGSVAVTRKRSRHRCLYGLKP
jgi:hypothetical protein